MRSLLEGDDVRHGKLATRILHRDILSDGGIDTVISEPGMADFEACATVSDGSNERVFAVGADGGLRPPGVGTW